MKPLPVLAAGIALFAGTSLVPAADDTPAPKAPWTRLFDGKTLEGWIVKSGNATYRVEDGAIVGKTETGSPNTFLCSTKEYGDFVLEFEVKCDNALNSGVQIRSKLKDVDTDKFGGRVYGPQVEIEASGDGGAEAGYVYGEATGRGWLTPDAERKPHRHFKDGEWNHYRIVAEGPRIRTWINGEPIADLTDEPIYETHPAGIIGLQVHGIPADQGPYEVRWRNLRLKELGRPAGAVTADEPSRTAFRPLFDGSSLDAWMSAGGGQPAWTIEDGTLARQPKSGDIWTRSAFGDFVLKLEFKVSPNCNSGVFFRSDPKNPVQGGFEIQVFDSAGRDNAGKHDAGALYDASPPTANVVKPAGEWNRLRIRCQGSRVVVHLNGTGIQDVDLDDWSEPEKNPDGSKNKFKTALKDLPRRGHIGFQDHGHPVWFRNVRIREL